MYTGLILGRPRALILAVGVEDARVISPKARDEGLTSSFIYGYSFSASAHSDRTRNSPFPSIEHVHKPCLIYRMPQH